MKTIIFLFILFILTSIVQAQVKSETILYQDGENELEGYLSYDKLLKSKRGGVLIVHDKYGINEFIKDKAKELAKLGYIAFATDMFGKDVQIDEKVDKTELMESLFEEDQTLIPHRAQVGLDYLSNHSKVDGSRLAVIGYGFGGSVAMELARSGVNLSATINYFGSLAPQKNESNNKVQGPVLVLIGSNDPKISTEELESFKLEMNSENNDWQINTYGGAAHGFTYYELGFEISNGEAYNYNADKRSWEAVKILLHETLK
jgi:dienelactone hydrolase